MNAQQEAGYKLYIGELSIENRSLRLRLQECLQKLEAIEAARKAEANGHVESEEALTHKD